MLISNPPYIANDYKLPKNIRAAFIDILNNNGYWDYQRNKTQ